MDHSFHGMRRLTGHRVIRRATDIDSIPSRLVRDLHAYWLAKCHGGALPSWAVIDPAEITHLLPNIIITGISHDPLTVSYRLAGTRIVDFRGEITGHTLGRVPWSAPEGQERVLEGFARVIATRAPLFTEAEIATREGVQHAIFAGIWPLSPDPAAPIDR